MSTSGSEFAVPVSASEAKLRRPQQGMEMDASLHAPPVTSRPHSRNKDNKVKMPIDWNIGEQPFADHESNAPTTDVRVNTFYSRHSLRVPSFSRSISGLSDQTSATDMIRHDSHHDHAFHTSTRGRARGQEELAPFEDKPEMNQKTVEATFDKREIYEVFATELPNNDYINANIGLRNAQLQFTQHPNGDVSAHMWSADCYEWQNIGSFSNIRKRVEGQIANDRLKGETAWQALQRNTLAYFRAIAKQKEQTAMGNVFGQVQIQALLPQPKEQRTPSEVKIVNKESQADASTLTESASSAPTHSTQANYQGILPPGYQKYTQEYLFYPFRQNATAEIHSRSVHAASDGRQPASTMQNSFSASRKPDDPFTSAVDYRQYRGHATPVAAIPTASSLSGRDSSEILTPAPFRSSLIPMPLFASGSLTQTSSGRSQPSIPTISAGIPGLHSIPSIRTTSSEHSKEHGVTPSSSIETPSRGKPVVPLSSQREAMRDQLLKLVPTATKRSRSQANIRTVLFDPYHDQSSHEEELDENNSYAIASSADVPAMDESRAHDKNWSTSQPSNALLRGSNDSKPLLPGRLAQQMQRQCSVGDSVPDNDGRYGRGSFHVLENKVFEPSLEVTKSQEMLDQELNDWWWSGNNVVRQEEFHQSILGLSKSSAVGTPARSHLVTPSSCPRPIGTRTVTKDDLADASPAKHTARPFNEATTRILIPVYENLASYVQGPLEKRRDYWSNWVPPPEYAIDRGPGGNNSFFEEEWGKPPARIGRDPRYARVPAQDRRFAGYSPGYGGSGAGSAMGSSPGSFAGGVIGSSPIAGGRGGAMSGGIPTMLARYPYGGGVAGGRY